jgi:hypothetical protein
LAAGLGRLDDFERLLPESKPEDRHPALALAASTAAQLEQGEPVDENAAPT